MDPGGLEEADRHDDATATMATALWGQVLNLDGWLANHADKGTFGPHVRIGAYGGSGRDAVVATSQVPERVACLTLLAGRVDPSWALAGEEKAPADAAPDPDDPAVERRRRLEQLELEELVAARIGEVVGALLAAEDRHDAVSALAVLLGVDEEALDARLHRVSLLGLTRGARAGRAARLEELRRDAD